MAVNLCMSQGKVSQKEVKAAPPLPGAEIFRRSPRVFLRDFREEGTDIVFGEVAHETDLDPVSLAEVSAAATEEEAGGFEPVGDLQRVHSIVHREGDDCRRRML